MWVDYTRFYRRVYLRHYLGNNNRIIALPIVCVHQEV